MTFTIILVHQNSPNYRPAMTVKNELISSQVGGCDRYPRKKIQKI